MINSFLSNSLKEEDSLQKNQCCKAYVPEVEFEKMKTCFTVKDLEWLCLSNNSIQCCCTTDNCRTENPFFCGVGNCQTCSGHSGCGPNIRFQYIYKQMNIELEKRKNLMLSLYRKEEEFVNNIRKMREKDISSDIFNFLDANLDAKMREIFKNHQKFNMTNSEIQ